MEVKTVKEAASILKCSYNKMLRLIHEGKIFAVQIGNGYRIPTEQLKKFMEGDEK